MPYTTSASVQTHACQSDLDTIPDAEALGLPRFSGSESDTTLLNDMAQQLESIINEKALKNAACQICPTNGAVILDCQECKDFDVVATSDINSITMLNCDSGDGTVNILVPPNTSRCICGWPETFGFEGGECFDGCVSGGTNPAGRTFTFPFQGTSRGPQAKGLPGAGTPTTGGGGAGGGGACACSPTMAGTLTLVCCTAACSIDCASTKILKLRACGGVPPYTWASTGNEIIESSGADNEQATITPPANPGSGVAGNAYYQYGYDSIIVFPNDLIEIRRKASGCNDQETAACGVLGTVLRTGTCSTNPYTNDCGVSGIICDNNAVCSQDTCDVRTQAMIDAGCAPCGISSGKVITVTDSIGTSASKTLTA